MAKRKKYRRRKPFLKRIKLWLMSLLAIGLTFYLAMSILTQPNVPFFGNSTSQSDVFIQRVAPHSQKIQREDGLLASISIGQAILESDWGTSGLSQGYNNLFGIKAFGNEPQVTLYTSEFENGEWIEIPASFRSYKSWEESMDDHVDLFKQGVSWNRDLYQGVLGAANYREAAHELQIAGYATDPNYEGKIINVIETYNLQRFDK